MTSEANKYGAAENPPYSLYQAENGLWGLIDKDGNKLEAAFKRGNNDHFSCTPYEVVTFDEEEGFTLLVWGEPWWDTTFSLAEFPMEFNQYLVPRFESHEFTEGDKNRINDVLATAELTDLQRQITEELISYIELEELDDDEWDVAEENWFSEHPKIDMQVRVDTLAEMLRTFGFDEKTKESIWFANFRFINLFG